MKLVPRPLQESAIQRIITEPTQAALIASELGTGKTLVAVESAIRLGLRRVLLIGVKDSYAQWAVRFLEQGGVVLRRMDGTKKGREALASFLSGDDGYFFAGSQFLAAQDWDHVPKFDHEGRPVMVIDKKTGLATEKQATERLHKKVYSKMKPVDMLIFDEVHMVANRKSVGRKTLISIKAHWRIAMSGTWYRNSFEGAWSVTRWLWPDFVDGNFDRWRSTWCATDEVYAKGGKTVTLVTGEANPGEYVRYLPCYVREEAAEQAPEPELVYVDLSPAQRAQYDQFEEDMLLWVEAHGQEVMFIADIPPTLRSRLRTVSLGEVTANADGEMDFALTTVSSKMIALQGVLESPDYAGQRVALYTHSKKFAKVLVARMKGAGLSVAEWSGDVSGPARDKIKAGFFAGEIQYLVCVIAAFNAALDGFQTVCNRVVWVSRSDDMTDNQQAIARFFRPGRIGEFKNAELIARDTHDEGVYSKGLTEALRRRQTLTLTSV